MGTKNTQIGDHHAQPGSPIYMAWLATLPDFLKAIVAEERGILLDTSPHCVKIDAEVRGHETHGAA